MRGMHSYEPVGDVRIGLSEDSLNWSKPFRADIELTRRCNQACIHCMANTGTFRDFATEMPLQQIVAILERLASEGIMVVQFTGGEPLLRPDFGDILCAAGDLGYFILLSTNGILLGEKVAELIAKYRVRVELSLDGACADMHDSIRGRVGSFDGVLKCAEYLNRLGCDFGFSTVLLKTNIEQVAQIVSLSRTLGAKRLFLKLPRLVGRMYPLRDDLCASFDDLVTTISQVKEKYLPDPNGMEIDVPSLPLHKPTHKSKVKFSCPAGTSKIGIGADGLTFPCLLVREPLGKLLEHSLEDLLNTNCVKAIREVQEHGSTQCLGCKHLISCRSGCRAGSLSAGRGLTGRDPLCDLYGRAEAQP